MFRQISMLIVVLVILFVPVSVKAIQTVTTSWGGDAEMVYDTGFMHMLMEHPGGGVSLFNMDLIQNDAPGEPVGVKKEFIRMLSGEKSGHAKYYISMIPEHTGRGLLYSPTVRANTLCNSR